MGLDLRGAALLAGVIYVSSSAVIVKRIVDLRRAANPESEVVLGVLVLEDVVVALLLALLGGEGPLGFLLSLFLALAYLAFARYLGPLLVRVVEAFSDELVLLLGAAFTTGTALLFHAAGASEGVGAFLVGVVAASLGLRERLERLFGPVRDLGVALFFLVVGAQALRLLEGFTPGLLLLALLALLLKLPLNKRGRPWRAWGPAGGFTPRSTWCPGGSSTWSWGPWPWARGTPWWRAFGPPLHPPGGPYDPLRPRNRGTPLPQEGAKGQRFALN